MFMSAPNVLAISNLVRQMKGRSAEKVKGEFIDLRIVSLEYLGNGLQLCIICAGTASVHSTSHCVKISFASESAQANPMHHTAKTYIRYELHSIRSIWNNSKVTVGF